MKRCWRPKTNFCLFADAGHREAGDVLLVDGQWSFEVCALTGYALWPGRINKAHEHRTAQRFDNPRETVQTGFSGCRFSSTPPAAELIAMI